MKELLFFSESTLNKRSELREALSYVKRNLQSPHSNSTTNGIGYY